MDVLENLGTAANIMMLGMFCVFVFLGLLVGVINILAKLCPADVQSPPTKQAGVANSVTPDVVAAITAAVHKYRNSRD